MWSGRAQLLADEVPGAFDEAAQRYDLMVALNPGYHRHLRDAAEALVTRLPDPRGHLVDLGCGSGASTRALVRAAEPGTTITGVDASVGMLTRARAKIWPPGVSFRHARAEELGPLRDDLGLADPVDGVFAAYLFRNVSERDDVLKTVWDVLRPGGVLVVQEYSVAGARLPSSIWSLICWSVVIPLSFVTSRQTRLYRYLWRSVQQFDSVTEFVDRLYAAGFADVEVRTVPGWQRKILHTFRAVRDPDPSGGRAADYEPVS